MDQNPYKSPAASEASAPKVGAAWRRWLAVLFALPSLAISGLCLSFVCAVVKELIEWPWETPRPALSEIAPLIAYYLASAATWGATAWATWKRRSRAVIAALLADLALVVLAVLAAD